MANYGMKVSQAGYDVLTAADRYLILKTDLTMLKVAFSGSTTVNGNTTGSVTHNLGYRPQFLVFLESTSVGGRMNLATGDTVSGVARADTTKVYWRIYGSLTGLKVYYYVFYEAM